MEIIIKDVNKYHELLQDLRNEIVKYQYLPSDEIEYLDVQHLCEKYFRPDKPIYLPRPYKFIRSYVYVQKEVERNVASITITGYDIYLNDKYEMIIVSDEEGYASDHNYGLFSNNFRSDLAFVASCAYSIKEHLMNESDISKIFKYIYQFEPSNDIEISDEEWLHIYHSIQDALRERSDEEDKRICNKILSYLHGKDKLTLDEFECFSLKENN